MLHQTSLSEKKIFPHLSSISVLKLERTNKQRTKDQSEKSKIKAQENRVKRKGKQNQLFEKYSKADKHLGRWLRSKEEMTHITNIKSETW